MHFIIEVFIFNAGYQVNRFTMMKKLFLVLMLSFWSLFSSRAGVTDLDVNAFEQKVADPSVAIIDVRSAEEYAAGHLRGASNVDWFAPDFVDQVVASYPKNVPLALYCRSGRRSASAGSKLAKEGYTVFNLEGGFLAWNKMRKKVCYYDVQTFFTPGGTPVMLTLIKHGSLEVSAKGVSIQIDPVTEYGRRTEYSVEFPKADVILVTHEHGDHLDASAIKALSDSKTRVIINAAGAEALGGGEVIANGGTATLPGGILLEAVPAYNTTKGREKFHPKGNGNGYVLDIDGLKIYIAGDTEPYPEMESLNGVDVALLPVNQPYTMTVDQCVKAAQLIEPKTLIPYHFSQTDISSLPALLPEVKVIIRVSMR